jgi:hypothetical protein
VKISRRPPGVPSSAPDAAFPYWSSDQAQRFRALVRAALAEAGIDGVRVEDGRVSQRTEYFGAGHRPVGDLKHARYR